MWQSEGALDKLIKASAALITAARPEMPCKLDSSLSNNLRMQLNRKKESQKKAHEPDEEELEDDEEQFLNLDDTLEGECLVWQATGVYHPLTHRQSPPIRGKGEEL